MIVWDFIYDEHFGYTEYDFFFHVSSSWEVILSKITTNEEFHFNYLGLCKCHFQKFFNNQFISYNLLFNYEINNNVNTIKHFFNVNVYFK